VSHAWTACLALLAATFAAIALTTHNPLTELVAIAFTAPTLGTLLQIRIKGQQP
jgi:hypothetical protein